MLTLKSAHYTKEDYEHLLRMRKVSTFFSLQRFTRFSDVL